MKILSLLVVLLPATLIAGCGSSTKTEDPVVQVSEDNDAMNAAMAKARQTLPEFIAALKEPGKGRSQYAIKHGFAGGGQVEHMWLTDVSHDGKRFHGTVNNDAELVKNVKLGDKVTLSPEEISDWMYVENGKLMGGFTIRVLRDEMKPEEQADFDKSMPFKFD